MKKLIGLGVFALAMVAQSFVTTSVMNGVVTATIRTSEGLRVFVQPSDACAVESIRVMIRTSAPSGFTVEEQTKGVAKCDVRPVEFRFKGTGDVLIAVYEMQRSNSAVAK